ncbi:hypothetical protein FCOIX_397 [Fusarium coicis]|nr:hypothetical protein FCOIX_397 [Fusarium coicis]
MANEKVPPNGGLGPEEFSKLTGDPSEGVGDLGDAIATPMSRQSAGFKELLAGMESLKTSVTSQLNMQSRQGTGSSKQVSNEGSRNVANKPVSPAAKLRYTIGAQFEVAIESWEVCEGFTLEGIVLQMAAQMTDDKDSAALQVRLEAFATIGDYLFTVSAEIPNIQSGQDLDIVFRLTMRLPAAPEGVCKALQSVSGGGQQYNHPKKASALVDDSLGHILQRDRMAAVLQLRVTKPAGQPSFRFNSLVFRFYGKINWRPELKNSEIGLELVDGDFLLVLAKDVYDDDAKLLIEARLYGTFVLGKTQIDAAVGFSRDHLGENRIQFELQVQPNMLSAMEFLNKLPVSKDGNTEPMNKGSTLSSLELPLGLQAMKTDLSQPNLKLSLAGSYSLTRSRLEMLQFTAFSRESLVFCLGFIDDARLRDLVLHVEIHTWTIVLSGKMDLGRFTATVEIVFIKGIGLRVRGNLASNSGCSLATLARMDIFNDKGKKSSMNIAQEASRANTGGGPPLDLSRGVLTRGTKLRFDLLVLKQEKNKGEQSTEEKPITGNEQPDKEDRIKFLSHFDLDWQIIQDKVKFENLSICFDVRNPRQENKRKMAGLLYATWRLRRVELFVYILGKKNAKDTDFWAGLNIKKTTRDSSKTAFDIINDPKFAGGEPGTEAKLSLPVKLPPDVKAKPEDQKVAEGLEFDGRLMVHFSKNKKDDKSFVLKDVSVYIDLESPFTISNYRMVGSFFMDLRIAYPMVKEKRDFSCYMKGTLEFEKGVYFSLEAEIPMNKKKLPEVEKKPEDQSDKPQKGLESTASKLNMDLPIRKTKVEKYLGNLRVQEEDIVCLAKVSQSKPANFTEDMNYESRLSTIGDSTQTEHEVPFKSLLASSYGSPTDDTIQGMVPKDNPLLQEKYQSSMQFAAVMVVRREMTGEKSERKVKAVAATLSSIDSWHIIQGKLWIQDVGLSVIVGWDDKRQKSISGVIQGTIILNNTAALATCVTYSQEVLTVSAVAEMNVKKLFESMDTDVSEEPDLAAAMDEKLPSLMIGMEAKFKEMKLQGYKVEVLATPDFELFGGFILQALWFTITHSRSVMPHTTDMELGGKMLLGKSVALEIRGKSSRNEIRISWIGHHVSPAKIVNGMVEGGLDGADGDKSKPELPTETGFGDWNKEEKKDALTSGKVVFVKDGSGRRFSSATLQVVLAESTREKAWMLIDGYIKLKEFALVIKIKAQKDNKKTLEVGLKAEFYLKDRANKDWPTGFDTIEMVATRWDIKFTLTSEPERTIGDIL